MTFRSVPRQLRPSELILLLYFIYVAVLSAVWKSSPNLKVQPLWILLAVGLGLSLIAAAENVFPVGISRFRDFLPLGLTLLAFEEMNLFAPTSFDRHLEQGWIRWDDVLLQHWHLRTAIESLGWTIPLYLELCYLLVYGIGTYCIIVLYRKGKRREVDHFFLVCLTGTLLAYALFPFFPTQPPRVIFPALDAPTITTSIRRFNLWILKNASIQVSVFPSAHVSSAFAAAWAMFLLLPRQKRFGWGVLAYAVSVSVATIYGRYHYTADVVAGIGISLCAEAVALWLRRTRPTN